MTQCPSSLCNGNPSTQTGNDVEIIPEEPAVEDSVATLATSSGPIGSPREEVPEVPESQNVGAGLEAEPNLTNEPDAAAATNELDAVALANAPVAEEATDEPDAAAEAAESQEVEPPEEASVEFAFENLDYDKVMESPELAESLKTEVHSGIVSNLGVDPDCVTVEISKGSVVVNASVRPALGGSADALKQQIDAAGDSFLQAVSECVTKIPSIKDVAVDPTAGFGASGLKTLLTRPVSLASGLLEALPRQDQLATAAAWSGFGGRSKTTEQLVEEGERAIELAFSNEVVEFENKPRGLGDLLEESPSPASLATKGISLEELKENAERNMRKHGCTVWNGEDWVYRDVWATRKRELAAYGEGVYLYFQLMGHMSILFLVLLLVSTPALITYVIGNMVNETNTVYEFIARFSIANLGYCPGGVCRTDEERAVRPIYDGSTLNVQEWTQGIGILDGLSMLIFVFCAVVYGEDWMWRSIKAVDEEQTTVSDFAIQIKRLPKRLQEDHENYEHKLRLFFQKRLEKAGVDDADCIQEICLLRGYDGTIGLFRSKGQLLHQRESIVLAQQLFREQGSQDKADKAQKALDKVNEKIVDLDKSIGKQATMTQKQRDVYGAFIIFNRGEYRDEMLYQYRISHSPWFRLLYKGKKFEGHSIHVTRACEPLDILWENTDYDHYRRLLRRFVTLILALALLFVCTALLVALQRISSTILVTKVQPKPVWVLKHAEGSNSKCLDLCGVAMYTSTNCNAAEGHSGMWDVAKVFDATGVSGIDVTSKRFIDFQTWVGLNKSMQDQCLNAWTSPACEFNLGTDARPGDWIAVEFSEPRLVQCISLGQSSAQISTTIDIFQCDAGREALYENINDFDPAKECVPLRRLYPAVDQIENKVAFSESMTVRVDAACQMGSSISYEVVKDAKANAENPEKDPIIACYCNAKVLELGVSFRLPPYSTDEQKICEEWASTENVKLGKMVGVVTVVLILNTILTYIFEYMIIWERHASQVDMTNSRQWKLLFAQFINTGVLYLIVNANFLGEFDWFPFVKPLKIGQGEFADFAPAWFTVVGASIFVTVTMCLVSTPVPTLFLSFVVNPILIRIYSAGLLTQETLNSVYQLPEWHISEKLAQALTVIFVVVMYAGGMPALYFVGFVFCVVTYWVEKWTLLRGSRKPPKYSHQPIVRGLWLTPVAVFFHVVITLWMFGNQQVFPSGWSNIISLWEAIIGMDRDRYEQIIRDFENGSEADQKALFGEYLHARVLDFARESCWLLLLIFSFVIILFVIYIVFLYILRPFVSPCEAVIRARIVKRRHQRVKSSKLRGRPFNDLKHKMHAKGHETSYLLAYNPFYQDAYVGMTGEPGSAPDLFKPPTKRAMSLATPHSKAGLNPPGLFYDPLTHVMIVLSVLAGIVVILAIIWND